MLVLGRKRNERIRIGKNVFITVVDIDCNQVRLGIEAPREIEIARTELDGRPMPAGGRPIKPCF